MTTFPLISFGSKKCTKNKTTNFSRDFSIQNSISELDDDILVLVTHITIYIQTYGRTDIETNRRASVFKKMDRDLFYIRSGAYIHTHFFISCRDIYIYIYKYIYI